MHLSDPWTVTPFRPRGYATGWNEGMELKCVTRADLVTFTSQRTLWKYQSKYPSLTQKFRYFPNVFDPRDAQPNPWRKSNKIRLLYSGSLPDSRNPTAFLTALKDFRADYPDKFKDFEVVFVGDASRAVRRRLSANTGLVRFDGQVSFAQSVKMQRNADVLLLIDNVLPEDLRQKGESYEFFPSKLLDYIVAERRILALTDNSSIAKEVISEEDLGDCFEHEDKAEHYAALLRIWEAWRSADEHFFRKRAKSATYSAQLNAEQLASEMRDILNNA